MTAAISPVIHERLEERRLFSIPVELMIDNPSPKHLKSHDPTALQLRLHQNGIGNPAASVDSPDDLAAAIAANGFDVSDGDGTPQGLTITVIPTSQMAADGFPNYDGDYPDDDSMIAIVQWSSTIPGSYSSSGMSGSTSGSNLYYSGSGTGGVAYVPISSSYQQTPATCQCTDDNPALDPPSVSFLDDLSTCGCETGGDDGADAEVQEAGDGDVDTEGGDEEQPDDESDDPVNFANGTVDQSDTDLTSDAFGSEWGITRNWTNNQTAVIQSDASTSTPTPSDPTSDIFGNNIVENQLGRVVLATDQHSNHSIGIATNGNDIFWFNWDGTHYKATSTQGGFISLSGSNLSNSATVTWKTESGAQTTFFGFESSTAPLQRGQFDSLTNARGITTSMTYNESTGSAIYGLPASLSQSATIGGISYNEAYTYSYSEYTSGTSTIERVTSIQLSTTVGTTTSDIQCVKYIYYGASDDNGNFGDLESATTYDGQGPFDSNALNHSPISEDYYRYYTSDSSGGYIGDLQFVVTGSNYARLAGEAAIDSMTVADLSDDTVADYANYKYTYEFEDRISSEIVAGAGGTTMGITEDSGLPHGFGEYTYTYTTSNDAYGYNSWTTKTVITNPNGSDEVVYTNFAGEVMLDIIVPDATDSASPSPTLASWVTDYQYSSVGQVIQIAEPSANLIDESGNAYNDFNSDPSAGYISTSSGLIESIAYGTSTTVSGSTADAAGDVLGYESSLSLQDGSSGTAVEQESWTYTAHSWNGITTAYALAAATTYGQTEGGDARTVSYSYTWQNTSNSISSVTATLPLISTAEDGPGGASYDTASIAYDNFGFPIWTQDGDGHVMYTQYNIATGAIVQQVADVNFNSGGGSVDGYALTYLPSSWTLPVGGLNIAETMTVDDQGRTTQAVTPDGNVIDTVYDDPDHEIRTYDGVLSGGELTEPAQISREQWNASDGSSFTESITYSGAIDLTANESPALIAGSIQTLSRSLLNNASQVIETDEYIDVSSPAYNASTPQIGSAYTNFYPTTYDYDEAGNLDRTNDANGTITRTVYDGLERPISSWVGTSDSVGWTPGYGNLVEVSSMVYDGGGVGDSNVTQSVDYPAGTSNSSTYRITNNYYDWRDREILGIDGYSSSQPIVVATSYDNADEVTEVQQYAGATYSLTGGNSSLLRAQSTTLYDDQGRSFQTSSFSVIQSGGSAGTVGTAITSKVFYDHRGEVMATEGSTGLWAKMVYDGAGRLVTEYQTDGAAGSTWTEASSVNYDHVFSQVNYIFNDDSKVVTTISADRFNTDATTATGPLGSPTSDTPQPADADFSTPDEDGGFAFEPTGSAWTFTTSGLPYSASGIAADTSGYPVYNPAPPDDEAQVAFLQGTAGMSQSMNLSAGTYVLSFDSAERPYYDAGQNFDVLVDGKVEGEFQPSSSSYVNFSTSSFYVTSGAHTISFEALDTLGGGDRTDFIADVQLTNVTTAFARISYAASYYDAADRDVADVNVGTNGGNVWLRPTSAPSRSSTVLETTTTYDAAGWVDTMTDPNGIMAKTNYDMLGRTTQTIANYNASSGITDSVNQTTDYTYDGDGNVTSMTAVMPIGEQSQTTAYIYGVTTAQGSSINDNDLLYETVYPDPTTGDAAPGWSFFNSTGITGNDSAFTDGVDAPEGEQAGILQQTGYFTQLVTFAAGTYTINFDSAQRGYGPAQEFEVLVDGNVVGTFTPASTSYESDSTDSFTVAAGPHVIKFLGIDPDGYDQTAFIDDVTVSDTDGTTAPTLGDAGFESPVEGEGNFDYDPSEITTDTYDALGETTAYNDREGVLHDYSYDSLGRLTLDYIVGAGVVDQTVKSLGYTYGDNGELSTATSYDSSNDVLNQVQETYDGFGQLASDAQAHDGSVADDDSTPTVYYNYDASNGDRLTSMTYPDGRTIDYNYSSGLDSVLSRVSTVSDDSGLLQAYSYLGMDTPVTLDDGNGVDLSYLTVGATGVGGDQYTGLDKFGRIDDQNWTGPYAGEGPDERPGVDQFTYTYDQDSNVLSKDEVTATTDSTTNTNLAAQSQSYTYDQLNRLTSFASDTMNATYTLNAVGDRIAINGSGGLITSTSDAQNELASVGGNNLTYDSNGNTDTDQNGYTYVYDCWNRLVSVNTGSDTIYYTYDALGRRITETDAGGLIGIILGGDKSHGEGGGTGSNGSAGVLSTHGGSHPLDDGYGDSGTTTDLYYSSANQVLEEQSSGVTTTQYVWSPFYVNQMIERDDHDPATSGTALNRRLYVEEDADYNVKSITNSSGSVVERYEYDADGNVTVLNPDGTILGDGTLASSFFGWIYTFQGGRQSVQTGLVRMGVRDDEPSTDTWIEPDPAGPAGSGTDLYQVEDGNAVGNVDPSGLQSAQPLPSGPSPSGPQLVGPEPAGPYPISGGTPAAAGEAAEGAEAAEGFAADAEFSELAAPLAAAYGYGQFAWKMSYNAYYLGEICGLGNDASIPSRQYLGLPPLSGNLYGREAYDAAQRQAAQANANPGLNPAPAPSNSQQPPATQPATPTPNGPTANGGHGPKHGGDAHNAAIDNLVQQLENTNGVTGIRKNQTQVNAKGDKVGDNRPDVQYNDANGQHQCVEFDNDPKASVNHSVTIRGNDPDAGITPIVLP